MKILEASYASAVSLWSLGLILITVTAVTAVRSVRLQTTLYSLPIPLTLGLLGSDGNVSNSQPLAFIGPVSFFYLVALLRRKPRWSNYPSALGAGLVVLVLLEALALLPGATRATSIELAVVLWLGIATIATRHLRNVSHCSGKINNRPRVRATAASALSVIPMLALVALTAKQIGSLGAMFPYAGMCVSLTIPDSNILEFANRFAIRSIGLISFNSTYMIAASETPPGISLTLGWCAYILAMSLILSIEPRITSQSYGMGRNVA